jgi:L-asparaginase/Glu-tRNA(Gln) amidotransferase subunit D
MTPKEKVTSTPVLHIALGGTIEYVFTPEKDGAAYPDRSQVIDFFEQLNKKHSFIESKTYCLVESDEITEEIIEKIIVYLTQTGKGCVHKQILLTLGLNKIREVADIFAKKLKNHGRAMDLKIILVGSRLPLVNRWYSDAQFNIPYAVSYLRYSMEPGEIVSFDGEEFIYHY